MLVLYRTASEGYDEPCRLVLLAFVAAQAIWRWRVQRSAQPALHPPRDLAVAELVVYSSITRAGITPI